MEGAGYWRYDDEVQAWYFGLAERAAPPYKRQVIVEAVVDLDDDGRVAGFEILSGEEALKPPLSVFPKEN